MGRACCTSVSRHGLRHLLVRQLQAAGTISGYCKVLMCGPCAAAALPEIYLPPRLSITPPLPPHTTRKSSPLHHHPLCVFSPPLPLVPVPSPLPNLQGLVLAPAPVPVLLAARRRDQHGHRLRFRSRGHPGCRDRLHPHPHGADMAAGALPAHSGGGHQGPHTCHPDLRQGGERGCRAIVEVWERGASAGTWQLVSDTR